MTTVNYVNVRKILCICNWSVKNIVSSYGHYQKTYLKRLFGLRKEGEGQITTFGPQIGYTKAGS